MRLRPMLAALLAFAALAAGPAAAEKPAPPRVLFLLADGYNHSEFNNPYAALRALGYAVDIAAPKAGPVKCGNHGEPEAVANLSLDDAKAKEYLALFLPGGHSPAELAKHDRALEICKTFMQNDQTVGAICHGPMLLLDAGLLDDRVMTALYKLKDERPEAWKQRSFGAYLDEPYVEDGNLITGRHVADVETFLPPFLEKLERAGGIPLPKHDAWAIVIYGGADGHTKWSFERLLSMIGTRVVFARSADELQKKMVEVDVPLHSFSSLTVINKAKAGDLDGSEAFGKIAASLEGQTVDVADDADLLDQLAAVHAMTQKHADAAASQEPATKDIAPEAAIALSPGFDDKAYVGMETVLRHMGYDVAIVAAKTGWIKGLNGLPAKATATYDDDRKYDIVVAPGVLWPDESDAEQRSKRTAWLLEQYKTARVMVAFNFDAYELAATGQFKDKPFASSYQHLWSFKRTGAKRSGDAATQSTDKLITVRNAEDAHHGIKLLRELLIGSEEEALSRPQDKDAVVVITADGKFQLNGEAVSEEQLAKRLGEMKAKQPDLRVLIDANKRTSVRNVVRVIDQLETQGIDRIGIRTRD